ncbi:MAG: IS3 family transposase [Candidatus Thermoplasmatota archaeon]|jgi:putative transposase|nr:IS3 family transposase [Candidatus Thermoplasmatota archaeon]
MTDMITGGMNKSRASYLSGISRSMLYYGHMKRKKRYDADLMDQISGIVKERPSYGTRRVTAMIRRSGKSVGRNRVRRHMRHMNLVSADGKKIRHHVPRILVVGRPDLMWETDFTKIYIEGEGWIYLTAHIDLCSRKIKGYLVSRMSRTAEMIEAVDSAVFSVFPDGNANGLRIRSDNGLQLRSSRFEKHLKDLGIVHETIHANTPEEDANIESFFGRFKDDYIYIRDFISYDEFVKYMQWAVNDYNTVRPHSSLGYMTPEEFEAAMKNEDFRKEWVKKQIGRYKHVEFLE